MIGLCESCRNFKGDCGHHYIDREDHICYKLPFKLGLNSKTCECYEEVEYSLDVALDYLELVVNDGLFSKQYASVITNKIIELQNDIVTMVLHYIDDEKYGTNDIKEIVKKYTYNEEN